MSSIIALFDRSHLTSYSCSIHSNDASLSFSFRAYTPLERCCVNNMSPFVSSSGLSPGSREAKVQRTKVCLNCTEPSVARSSCWSLPVGRYLSDTRCKGVTSSVGRTVTEARSGTYYQFFSPSAASGSHTILVFYAPNGIMIFRREPP